jgi:ATP-dependent DNA helicase RecQ
VFDRLRELRNTIAKENSLPPYVIFSDKTLKELSSSKPTTKEQMLLVHGIGEVKFQRYGEMFLEELQSITNI